jgi:hypothetical protein
VQARKQALADALFDNENVTAGPLLDEDTLRDLFAPLRERLINAFGCAEMVA